MLMFVALYIFMLMYFLCVTVLSTLPSLEVEADLRYKPHFQDEISTPRREPAVSRPRTHNLPRDHGGLLALRWCVMALIPLY
jgi:hypothetical protein